VLNLKTKGLNNAAAVLGGYDAMVKAGLPVETGKPNASPAPEAKKVQPAQAAQASQTAASNSVHSDSAPAAPQTRHAKRRKTKTKH
jgi:3-mercaptopyruvate sulfurtransferase SseA